MICKNNLAKFESELKIFFLKHFNYGQTFELTFCYRYVYLLSGLMIDAKALLKTDALLCLLRCKSNIDLSPQYLLEQNLILWSIVFQINHVNTSVTFQ